jgi:hypothetical protein
MEKSINNPKLIRNFGGKIDGFKNKEERNFEKKHLKAYLKGDRQFRNGYLNTEAGRQINWAIVKELWT